MNKQKSKAQIAVNLLWIMCALVCVKSIFADTASDNSYQVAMAYRHINGDKMFSSMLEPHQTSCFLTHFLMLIYRFFVPSLSGVVIYLQIVGTYIYAIICIPLYKVINKISGTITAQLVCIIFMVYRVKQSPFPEYGNMEIAFSTLLFVSLTNYLFLCKKRCCLILSAVFLALTVLTYPSAIVVYVVILALLCLYSESKGRDILTITCICIGVGIVYILAHMISAGPHKFIQSIKMMVVADSHSAGKISTGLNYFSNLFTYSLWIFIVALIVSIVWLLLRNIFGFTKENLVPIYFALLLVSGIGFILTPKFTGLYVHEGIYILCIPILVVVFLSWKLLNDLEKKVWILGTSISAGSALAVAILSNEQIHTYLAYMVIAIMVSLIPIMKLGINGIMSVICIELLVLLHRGVIVNGYINENGAEYVWEVNNYIRNGALRFIVCDTAHAEKARDMRIDFEHNIMPEDTLFLATYEYLFDPIAFTYSNAKVANPSVINTATYSSSMLDYYSLYPDKKPTVVALYSPYGYWGYEESWFLDWIEENYTVVDNGYYWTFYR